MRRERVGTAAAIGLGWGGRGRMRGSDVEPCQRLRLGATLSGIEAGTVEPRISMLKRIVAALEQAGIELTADGVRRLVVQASRFSDLAALCVFWWQFGSALSSRYGQGAAAVSGSTSAVVSVAGSRPP
jgi:hypothetical protein